MKVLEALIAASLVGCAPIQEQTKPAPATPQCQADAREVEALSRELAEIEAALDQGAPEDLQSAIAQAALLLEHPVFHTREGRPAVDVPAEPRAFIDWWNRGGDSWAHRRVHRSPTIVEVPPSIRSVIDKDAVPDEILCESPVCDPMAADFIRTDVAWGLEFEAYERGRFFAVGPVNHWQRECVANTTDEWLDCVSRRRSAHAELPLGEYRFPTSGWFFVSRYGLIASACPSYLGVNLETGEVLSASDCDVHAGRGSAARFREFALLALLAKEAEDVAQWQRLAVPPNIDVTAACSLDSAPPAIRIRTSAHARLSYWWWRDGTVVAAETLATNAQDRPASAFALKLLQVAEYTVVEGNASLPEQIGSTDRELAALLATLRPQ
jgi:hypothetical protein